MKEFCPECGWFFRKGKIDKKKTYCSRICKRLHQIRKGRERARKSAQDIRDRKWTFLCYLDLYDEYLTNGKSAEEYAEETNRTFLDVLGAIKYINEHSYEFLLRMDIEERYTCKDCIYYSFHNKERKSVKCMAGRKIKFSKKCEIFELKKGCMYENQ